jgi:hypothetical protein
MDPVVAAGEPRLRRLRAVARFSIAVSSSVISSTSPARSIAVSSPSVVSIEATQTWRSSCHPHLQQFPETSIAVLSSLYSEGVPSFTVGVNRVRFVPQATGVCPAGTPTRSIDRANGLYTGSADSRHRHAAGVGAALHPCLRCAGSPGDGLPREGVNRAGGCAARHDRHGESHVEKPRGDDSVADGSPRDRATGRSRARVETRPADLGSGSPETDRHHAGFPLCREATPFTARRMSPQDSLVKKGDFHLLLCGLSGVSSRVMSSMASKSSSKEYKYSIPSRSMYAAIVASPNANPS